MNLEKKRVLVTGASKGIGLASAQRFAAKGANVILVSRNKENLAAAEQKISKNTQIMTIECDVSDQNQVQDMVKQVDEKFGGIDILVNNAGFAIYDAVIDQSIEQINSQMSVLPILHSVQLLVQLSLDVLNLLPPLCSLPLYVR